MEIVFVLMAKLRLLASLHLLGTFPLFPKWMDYCWQKAHAIVAQIRKPINVCEYVNDMSFYYLLNAGLRG